MYTVSKGPSKLLATRRGLTTNHLDRIENIRDNPKKKIHDITHDIIANDPKPVFLQINSKKLNNLRTPHEIITPQHEELIKFVSESWKSVIRVDESNNDSIVYYEDSENDGKLQDFEPFDLDSWWGKRIYNTITKSVP